MPEKRKRRRDTEIFMDGLTEISNGELKLIGNKTLRDALGWDEDEERYNRAKSQLVQQNAIIVGRGYGGSVGLASVKEDKKARARLFVSYSHADESLKSELIKHLEPLRRLNLIEAWNDRQIKAGDEWDKKISANLEKADIILLLVSIDFINSAYCYDVELDRALELHESGKAVVIPVILRNCLWSYTPFAKLQALPKDAKAISTWHDHDEAFASVAESVRVAAQKLLETR
jgi:TIR domain